MKKRLFITACSILMVLLSGCKNEITYKNNSPVSDDNKERTITVSLVTSDTARSVDMPDITSTGVGYYCITTTQSYVGGTSVRVYDFEASDSIKLVLRTGECTFEVTGYKSRSLLEEGYVYSSPVLYYKGEKNIASQDDSITITVFPIVQTYTEGQLKNVTGLGNLKIQVKRPSDTSVDEKIQSVKYNCSSLSGCSGTIIYGEYLFTAGNTAVLNMDDSVSIGKHTCIFTVTTNAGENFLYSKTFYIAMNLETVVTLDLSSETLNSKSCGELGNIEFYEKNVSPAVDLLNFDSNQDSAIHYLCEGVDYTKSYVLKISMKTASQKITVSYKKSGDADFTVINFQNLANHSIEFIDNDYVNSKNYAQRLIYPLDGYGGWIGTTGGSTLKIDVSKGGESKSYYIDLAPDQTNYYVSASTGDAAGPGTKTAPYKTIQQAVDKIVAANDESSNYNIVLLEDMVAGTTDFSDFSSTVTDVGSYVRIEPGKTLNLTIKSNGTDNCYKIDAGGSAITTVSGAYPVNGARVIQVFDKTNLTLENVQVTGGYVPTADSPYYYGKGAGVYCVSNAADGQIKLTLTGKTVIGEPYTGLVNTAQPDESIKNNCANQAYNGGGISAYSIGTALIEVEMKDQSSVAHNNATYKGSGIFIQRYSKLIMDTYSSVYANVGGIIDSYGRGAVNLRGDAVIKGSIHHNYSEFASGGLEVTNELASYPITVDIEDGASIHDNKSKNGGFGGAIHLGAAVNNDKIKINLNGGNIYGNTSSSSLSYEIHSQSPYANINLSKNVSFTGEKTFLVYDNAVITLLDNPEDTKSYKIMAYTYTPGNAVIKGDAGVTLTSTDCSSFKAKIYGYDTEYDVALKPENNTGVIHIDGTVNVSGSDISYAFDDGIIMDLNSATNTISVKQNGTTLTLTDDYTIVQADYYNGGALYKGNVTVTGNKIGQLPTDTPPGTYYLYVTIKLLSNSKLYKAAFRIPLDE